MGIEEMIGSKMMLVFNHRNNSIEYGGNIKINAILRVRRLLI
jgi:hypothetical protein